MKIEVYIDDDKEPISIIRPPEKFQLDSTKLHDGPHQLLFKAIDKSGDFTTKIVNFNVQNGPAIVVHGIDEDDTLSGQISVLANAYGAKVGDEFEPVRMETPRPVPTWAWVLSLVVIGWAAGYISLALNGAMSNEHFNVVKESSQSVEKTVKPADSAEPSIEENASNQSQDWVALGNKVYGNNCSSCHQASGTGLPGVFPPLKGNPAVVDENPQVHIEAILNGVANKEIDGVLYTSPMPAFGSLLSDEEIAAVVNHERKSWGNDAVLVNPEDVLKLR